MGFGLMVGWVLAMIALYFKSKAVVEQEEEDERKAKRAALDLAEWRKAEFLKRSIELAKHNGYRPDSRL